MTGPRASRTDLAMVPALNVDSVDAVFEEESINFVNAAAQPPQSSDTQNKPTTILESLSSQLAMLESQCDNLRRMLEVASLGKA